MKPNKPISSFLRNYRNPRGSFRKMARSKRKNTFGISVEPSWAIDYCVRLGILAEELVFSNVWVPDGGPQPPYSDSVVTLTALASRTRSIKLGSAIFNFYTRNPAWIASSFAAISDLASHGRRRRASRERMVLGIGIGSGYNVSKFGIQKRSGTISNLREAIESIRELFVGKQVTVRTDAFSIESVSIGKLERKIPIYIGAAGPKALRLAGEIADGVILTDRVPADLPNKLRPIELGLGDSSRRRRDIEIVNSVVISVDENGRRARDAARTSCAYLVAWMEDSKAAVLGLDVEKKAKIVRFLNAGDEHSAARIVDEKMVTTLTISGTKEECVERCREHLEYDIDQIVFCEPFGPQPEKSLRIIAKEVIPKI